MTKQERRKGEFIDQTLRKLRRKLKQEGTFQELKNREFFEKPSEQKKKRQKAAVRRTRIQQQADEL